MYDINKLVLHWVDSDVNFLNSSDDTYNVIDVITDVIKTTHDAVELVMFGMT